MLIRFLCWLNFCVCVSVRQLQFNGILYNDNSYLTFLLHVISCYFMFLRPIVQCTHRRRNDVIQNCFVISAVRSNYTNDSRKKIMRCVDMICVCVSIRASFKTFILPNNLFCLFKLRIGQIVWINTKMFEEHLNFTPMNPWTTRKETTTTVDEKE